MHSVAYKQMIRKCTFCFPYILACYFLILKKLSFVGVFDNKDMGKIGNAQHIERRERWITDKTLGGN